MILIIVDTQHVYYISISQNTSTILSFKSVGIELSYKKIQFYKSFLIFTFPENRKTAFPLQHTIRIRKPFNMKINQSRHFFTYNISHTCKVNHLTPYCKWGQGTCVNEVLVTILRQIWWIPLLFNYDNWKCFNMTDSLSWYGLISFLLYIFGKRKGCSPYVICHL